MSTAELPGPDELVEHMRELLTVQCIHGHDHLACLRCSQHPSTAYTTDHCRCPTCQVWAIGYRAEHPKPAPNQGIPTETLSFSVNCPDCGGPLRWFSNSRGGEREVAAVVQCTACKRHHVIRVFLLGPNGRRFVPSGARP